jgi:hypothetical protein
MAERGRKVWLRNSVLRSASRLAGSYGPAGRGLDGSARVFDRRVLNSQRAYLAPTFGDGSPDGTSCSVRRLASPFTALTNCHGVLPFPELVRKGAPQLTRRCCRQKRTKCVRQKKKAPLSVFGVARGEYFIRDFILCAQRFSCTKRAAAPQKLLRSRCPLRADTNAWVAGSEKQGLTSRVWCAGPPLSTVAVWMVRICR